MNNHSNKVNTDGSLEKFAAKSSLAEGLHAHPAEPVPVSPLGWSIKGRLGAAAAASALLWVAVAWAIGWLK